MGLDYNETYLIQEGLIEKLDNGNYKLTSQRGHLAKDIGGYSKFKKYRHRELHNFWSQRNINLGLLLIACLALFSPLATEIIKQKWFNQTVPLKTDSILNRTTHQVDTISIK